MLGSIAPFAAHLVSARAGSVGLGPRTENHSAHSAAEAVSWISAWEDAMSVLRVALVVFSTAIGFTCGLQAHPQSANGGPSLDETLNYVNSRFVDTDRSRSSKVSLSTDHQTLIFTTYSPKVDRPRKDSDWYRTSSEAPVITLDSTSIRSLAGDISITCSENASCVGSTDDIHGKTHSNSLDLFSYPRDEDQSERLAKAYRHLIELLQAEHRAKRDQGDPFAN